MRKMNPYLEVYRETIGKSHLIIMNKGYNFINLLQTLFPFLTIQFEDEGQGYQAQKLIINNLKVRYRQAKITAKKNGAFVTLWKRVKGLTCPYDSKDELDLVVIAVQKGKRTGLFIFPKQVLFDKGILSLNKKGGKRGFRVYPSWDKTNNNKQAQRTQQWQSQYFVDTKYQSKIKELILK